MKTVIKKGSSWLCVLALLCSMLGVIGALPAAAITGGGSAGTGTIYSWGCDMSYYNVGGDALDYSMVDFDLMKADGCDYVILRIGYEASATRVDTLDKAFVGLYNKARAAGMGVGVYFYALAKTQAGAIQDAQWCIDIFEQYDMYFEYPIYYDVEDPGSDTYGRVSHASLSSAETTALCLGWAQTLEAAGYFPGVYAGAEIFNDLTSEYKNNYDTWIAHVKNAYSGAQFDPSSDYRYSTTYGMWQYKWYNTSSSSPSYNGSYWKDSHGYPLDCNVAYKDYPSIIAAGGYNNMATRHEIQFETNGGSAIDPVYVIDGETLTEPSAPTKYGFEFGGWYCNPELTDVYDFSTPVPYGFTLYAKWNEAYWGANTNLMPNSQQMQLNAFNDAGESIWPYWNDDSYGSVTMYNAVSGSDWSWPSAYMNYENSFDAANDSYIYVKKDGTAQFNAEITYMDRNGELHTVKLSQIAGNGDTDFAAGYMEFFVDFGRYVADLGHLPDSGNVKFTKVTYYVVGPLDSYVKLYDMKLTPEFEISDPYVSLYDKNVNQISGAGSYVYDDGVLTMNATSADGYSVKFNTDKSFNPTAMPYLLADLTSTVPFNITMELTRSNGDATMELRSEFFDCFGLSAAPEALPAGSWRPVAMNIYGYYTWNGGAVSESTIKSVTITLCGEGTLTLKALQTACTETVTYVADGEYASGSRRADDTFPTELTSSVYTVADGYVDGVQANTTVGDFLGNFDQTEGVVAYDAAGNLLDVSATVATGMTVKLENNGAVVCAYSVAVKGDVNGDGSVTTVDARAILMAVLGEATLDTLQTYAADYDSNSSLSTMDVRELLKAILG